MRINLLDAVVERLTVMAAEGFTGLSVAELGVKLQVAPDGMAEQEAALRVNVPLKPFVAVIASAKVPEPPGAVTLTTGLDEVIRKSGNRCSARPATRIHQIERVHGSQASGQIVAGGGIKSCEHSVMIG